MVLVTCWVTSQHCFIWPILFLRAFSQEVGLFCLGRAYGSCSLFGDISDNGVWTSSVGRSNITGEVESSIHSKKGMVEGATSITAAAFHPKIEFHLMLQKQTKPVLRCLKDNCCETGSWMGQEPGMTQARDSKNQNERLGVKLVVGYWCSSPFVLLVSCPCFTTLLPNPEISFAALERWLRNTPKSRYFSGFRGLAKVAQGIQREWTAGAPCFSWAHRPLAFPKMADGNGHFKVLKKNLSHYQKKFYSGEVSQVM